MARVHYSECPVCGSKRIDPLLTVKDFSVSGEEFVLWQCGDCSLRFTQDVPEESEIGPYYKSEDYISHTNTDKGFINKTYKRVRNHTLQKKADLIVQHTALGKGRLIDIGCGTGGFLNTMQERGWDVTGIEPDEDARRIAKQLYGLSPLPSSSLTELPKESFDAVTLWHVLEHVHDLKNYIQLIKSLLTPSGKIFIAVPNYQSVDASIYGAHWAAYDVPRHLYHFSPRSVSILLRDNGLKLLAKQPMWFDSFYISLLSSKYRNGKTGYVSSFINGIRSNVTAAINNDRCSSLVYIATK